MSSWEVGRLGAVGLDSSRDLIETLQGQSETQGVH